MPRRELLKALLATFQKAVELAAKLRRSGTSVSIILRDGRWHLSQGMGITEKNAESGAPLLVTTFPGEEAVLIGGFPGDRMEEAFQFRRARHRSFRQVLS